MPEKPEEPTLEEIPPQPDPDQARFQPDITLLDHIIPSRKRRKRNYRHNLYKGAHARWKKEKDKIEAENERRRQEYEAALDEWATERKKVRGQREEAAKRVEQLWKNYMAGEKAAVEKVMAAVLAQSEYPLDDMFEGEPEGAQPTIEDAIGKVLGGEQCALIEGFRGHAGDLASA